MKNKGQQAYVHSKIEVIQTCAMVKEKTEESQVDAKRVTENRNPEVCATTRAKKAKVERNQGRAETLAFPDINNHSEIIRLHEEKRINYYNKMSHMSN